MPFEWCKYVWYESGQKYRCTQLADHQPHNVHTSENGKLHVERGETQD
ncbi:hypothetical protein Fullmetal_14 [Microbacterium phage Fullmetal]|uniref:Uncharacterized protein n=5 Tax=Akonivirus TaxID=2842540 RepID=A0A6M3T3Q6_9CAUD|nr:hypothetical protein HWD33_gp14 [Microbacterium phage Phedro]QJD52866.1 hypothetical protein SEA_PHRACTURED_14 [Microbacterium phage Phractured]QJD52976.1 hypothetical protein SEA_PHARKY_14 [Microbacterium phage Pharky]QNL30316.1 hypothetical protein SEA_MAZUN_14 [Microbacterium phage Mazun]QWY82706.1 hypothetical protein SEA_STAGEPHRIGHT_14 [Microbacterium phage StagePhright]UXE04103.1 hypothetical protein Fullmetal_14 [Microbacterium phage Fullmetal]